MLLNCGIGEDCWSPLNCKEIKPVNPKGNQSRVFIGYTDTEAEAPILWLPDAKSWLIGKDPDAGKDWRQEKKGTTENEMVGLNHQLDGHEYEPSPGIGDGHIRLMLCSPWGLKESDTTRWRNWTDMVTKRCRCFSFFFSINFNIKGKSSVEYGKVILI